MLQNTDGFMFKNLQCLIIDEAKSGYQNIDFLISEPKHMLWVLKRTVSMRRFFVHPKHMFKLMDYKIFTILRSTILFI